MRKERFIHFSRPIHFIINDLYERAKTAKFLFYSSNTTDLLFFLLFIITKQLVGILWLIGRFIRFVMVLINLTAIYSSLIQKILKFQKFEIFINLCLLCMNKLFNQFLFNLHIQIVKKC